MSVSVPDTAVCLQCGYSLRGLTELRCPECGRAFDPADPRTLGPRRPWQWLERWAAPPPAWHLIGIAVTTALAICGSSGSPGNISSLALILSTLSLACGSVLLLIVVGIDYLLRVLAAYR